jgi:magnesium-transporting ATPase (P-type)
MLQRAPLRGHLLDRRVLQRAFGALGPAEALVEMAAFFATFLAVGWRPGQPFPSGATLMVASGAAFASVVLGQLANAFACRSERRWPGALGWTTNRLLLVAVAVELVLLVVFLWVPAIANLLGQAPPTSWGLAVALCAVPAVLAADAVEKRRREAPPD